MLLKREIERRGHECTARWITVDTSFDSGTHSDDERRRLAIMDEEDVRRADDGLVLLAESAGHNVPGGKHVETGMALAWGRPVYVIHRRENVFHWHPRTTLFASVEEFLGFLDTANRK